MKNTQNLLLPLMALVLVGGGCFNTVAETTTERRMESQTGGKVGVEIDGEDISYTDEETGNTVTYGSNIQLPVDFPTDFPVYANANIISAANVVGEGVSLLFSSDDEAADVQAWYDAQLRADGYVLETDLNSYGQMMRSYAKGKVRMAVSIAQSNGMTTATIVRTQE